MTLEDLKTIWLDADLPPPCVMADGRMALLIFGPHGDDGAFGFQVPGHDDIRWRVAGVIGHVGGGALVELPAPPDPAVAESPASPASEETSTD